MYFLKLHLSIIRVNVESNSVVSEYRGQSSLCDLYVFSLDDDDLMPWWSCGSVYVIDLGSVHGTFVANERLSKDNPVELEVGQSLKFAASTRTYVLRKIVPEPAIASSELPAKFVYPPAPDATDEEAVVAYNTSLNRLGVPSPNPVPTYTYQRYHLLSPASI